MIDMTNFKKSVKWYDENLATLLPQYRGKYVGVCIDKVCGSWDDQDVGFDDMANRFALPKTISVVQKAGYDCPAIVTPDDFMKEELDA